MMSCTGDLDRSLTQMASEGGGKITGITSEKAISNHCFTYL